MFSVRSELGLYFKSRCCLQFQLPKKPTPSVFGYIHVQMSQSYCLVLFLSRPRRTWLKHCCIFVSFSSEDVLERKYKMLLQLGDILSRTRMQIQACIVFFLVHGRTWMQHTFFSVMLITVAVFARKWFILFFLFKLLNLLWVLKDRICL